MNANTMNQLNVFYCANWIWFITLRVGHWYGVVWCLLPCLWCLSRACARIAGSTPAFEFNLWEFGA